MCERGPDAKRASRCSQLIYQSIHGQIQPFFQALKKNRVDFHWNEKYETSFQGLKRYLASPPLLSKPTSRDILFLYLAISNSAVSGALIREDKGIQKLVYYISHSMNGP